MCPATFTGLKSVYHKGTLYELCLAHEIFICELTFAKQIQFYVGNPGQLAIHLCSAPG